MARMGERRGEVHTGFGWRDLRERDHLEGLGMDERVILKCISKRRNRGEWTRLV